MTGLWFMASAAAAGVIQDWSGLEPGKTGTYTDNKGTRLELAASAGPQKGEKALKVSASIVEWGGVWAAAAADLSKASAVRFSTKSSVPLALQVGFTDRQKTQYVATVRVLSTAWTEFTVPLSSFQRTAYPMPEAPKNAAMNWGRVESVLFSPQRTGQVLLEIGPVSGVSGKVVPKTGDAGTEEGALTVQDFALLDKNAYGPWDDKKSTIQFTTRENVGEKGGWAATCHYDLKPFGWCGFWARCGDLWGGQDWRGARRLVLRVYSQEPLVFQFGFNDANQNAYIVKLPSTRGIGWETVGVPFNQFQLNPYYQPEGARKGEPLDVSHVETFNLAPLTEGAHDFKVGTIGLIKK